MFYKSGKNYYELFPEKGGAYRDEYGVLFSAKEIAECRELGMIVDTVAPIGAVQVKDLVNSPAPSSQCYAENYPVSSIRTDERRFQNRTDAFSEVSARNVAENYNPNLFDPIVVWRDPRDGKIYVLSGHSRFEGVKRRGEKSIPVRFFEGTEAQAIEFARVDANRAATAENLIEDLTAYKLMRDGDKKAGIKPATKKRLSEAFKGKHNKLEAFSYLDPAGKFITALGQENKSEYPFIENRALWVGELRAEYEDFTNLHERDVFNFLYSDKKNLGLSKEDFVKLIETRLAWGKERLFPECSDDLNCEKIKDLGEVGAHRGLYKKLENLNEKRNFLNERLRTEKDTIRVWTNPERDVVKKLLAETDADIKKLRAELNIVENAPGFFGTPQWKKTMTADEVVQYLIANDWEFDRQKGSHAHYSKNSRLVTVPMHKGNIPKGTLKSIEKRIILAQGSL